MNHNLTSRQFLAKSIGIAATLTLICLMASVIVRVQAQEEHEALTIRVSTNRLSCMAGEVIMISGWVGCTKCGDPDPGAVVSVEVAGPRGAVLSKSVGTGSDGRFSVQVDTTAFYPGPYGVTASVVRSSLSGTWVQTSSRTHFTIWSSSTQTGTYPTVPVTKTYPTATAIVTVTYPTATAPVTATVTKEPTVATTRVPPANLVSDVAVPVAVAVTATVSSIAIGISQGSTVYGWWKEYVVDNIGNMRDAPRALKRLARSLYGRYVLAPGIDKLSEQISSLEDERFSILQHASTVSPGVVYETGPYSLYVQAGEVREEAERLEEKKKEVMNELRKLDPHAFLKRTLSEKWDKIARLEWEKERWMMRAELRPDSSYYPGSPELEQRVEEINRELELYKKELRSTEHELSERSPQERREWERKKIQDEIDHLENRKNVLKSNLPPPVDVFEKGIPVLGYPPRAHDKGYIDERVAELNEDIQRLKVKLETMDRLNL